MWRRGRDPLPMGSGHARCLHAQASNPAASPHTAPKPTCGISRVSVRLQVRQLGAQLHAAQQAARRHQLGSLPAERLGQPCSGVIRRRLPVRGAIGGHLRGLGHRFRVCRGSAAWAGAAQRDVAGCMHHQAAAAAAQVRQARVNRLLLPVLALQLPQGGGQQLKPQQVQPGWRGGSRFAR